MITILITTHSRFLEVIITPLQKNPILLIDHVNLNICHIFKVDFMPHIPLFFYKTPIYWIDDDPLFLQTFTYFFKDQFTERP